MTTQVATQPWLESFQFENFPVLKRMFVLISERPEEMDLQYCENGVEFRFKNQIDGLPNRGWLRIYLQAPNKCVLFFHKKSSIPFSRDRFSYGGVVIDARSTSRFEDTDIQEWIEFLLSGLPPKLRPSTLKKSLPYTIPEN